MLASDLHQLIYVTPFRPFRIIMADGASYDVRFRESFLLTQTFMTVGLLPSDNGQKYERVVNLDVFSITTIEPLPVAVKPQGNGQAPS